MLDLLNVVGTVAIHTLTITMQVVTPIPMGKQLNEVTPVELKRGGLLVENCKFYGAMVPYERTWPVEIDDTVLPPEPGKIAGYGMLINKKVCEGKAPENVTLADSFHLKLWGSRFQEGFPVNAVVLDRFESTENLLWVTPVMEVLRDKAETDAAARAFLDGLEQKTASQAKGAAE